MRDFSQLAEQAESDGLQQGLTNGPAWHLLFGTQISQKTVVQRAITSFYLSVPASTEHLWGPAARERDLVPFHHHPKATRPWHFEYDLAQDQKAK